MTNTKNIWKRRQFAVERVKSQAAMRDDLWTIVRAGLQYIDADLQHNTLGVAILEVHFLRENASKAAKRTVYQAVYEQVRPMATHGGLYIDQCANFLDHPGIFIGWNGQRRTVGGKKRANWIDLTANGLRLSDIVQTVLDTLLAPQRRKRDGTVHTWTRSTTNPRIKPSSPVIPPLSPNN